MTEEAVNAAPDATCGTGLSAVDAVLDDVVGLAERPIEQHVGVYESAHEVLRRALDAAGDES